MEVMVGDGMAADAAVRGVSGKHVTMISRQGEQAGRQAEVLDEPDVLAPALSQGFGGDAIIMRLTRVLRASQQAQAS